MAEVSKRRFLSGTVLLWLILTGVLFAEEERRVSFLSAGIVGDTLYIRMPFDLFFTPADSQAIVDGQEITLLCRLELWQKRRLWFDRLRQTDFFYCNLSYDRWQERFVVIYIDDFGWKLTKLFGRLDSLWTHLRLNHPFLLALESEDLSRDSYLACAVDIKYLTAEKIAQLLDWLAGRKIGNNGGRKKNANPLPDNVIELLLQTSGFRNRSSVQTSETFVPAALQDRIYFGK